MRLHGGGCTIGAGVCRPMTDAALAKRGTIMVTVNYRLGHLGFSRIRRWKAEKAECIHNFALLDQIAALRWVRDNIAVADTPECDVDSRRRPQRAVVDNSFAVGEGAFIKRLFRVVIRCRIPAPANGAKKGVALAEHLGFSQCHCRTATRFTGRTFGRWTACADADFRRRRAAASMHKPSLRRNSIHTGDDRLE